MITVTQQNHNGLYDLLLMTLDDMEAVTLETYELFKYIFPILTNSKRSKPYDSPLLVYYDVRKLASTGSSLRMCGLCKYHNLSCKGFLNAVDKKWLKGCFCTNISYKFDPDNKIKKTLETFEQKPKSFQLF